MSAPPLGLSPNAYPLLRTQPRRKGERLKVKNETSWRTTDLRRFFLAALRYLGLSEQRQITVDYRRRLDAYGVSGYATVRGRTMTLFVPRPDELVSVAEDGREVSRLPSFFREGVGKPAGQTQGLRSDLRVEQRRCAAMREHDLEDLGDVFLHELEHNLGLDHEGMTCGRYGRKRNKPWFDATALAIRSKPTKPAPSRDERRAAMVEAREAKARASLERWERKLRLARTKVGAWKRRVAYYERKRAACAKAVQP